MTKKEAISYLQQLYPNGGHCWLDKQRIEAIDMAVKTLQEEPVSIWHDASEKSLKPLGTKVLALFDDGALVELSIVDMNDIGGVVKYAYIEDLLPSDLIVKVQKGE